jgi:hypothetical protein
MFWVDGVPPIDWPIESPRLLFTPLIAAVNDAVVVIDEEVEAVIEGPTLLSIFGATSLGVRARGVEPISRGVDPISISSVEVTVVDVIAEDVAWMGWGCCCCEEIDAEGAVVVVVVTWWKRGAWVRGVVVDTGLCCAC